MKASPSSSLSVRKPRSDVSVTEAAAGGGIELKDTIDLIQPSHPFRRFRARPKRGNLHAGAALQTGAA